MDTVVKPTRPSPLPPPKEVTPLPSQLEVGSNDEEIDETNDDEDDDVMEFDDFQDDLIGNTQQILFLYVRVCTLSLNFQLIYCNLNKEHGKKIMCISEAVETYFFWFLH